MVTTIQSTDLPSCAREVLDDVRTKQCPVVVFFDDTPQAAIVPYADFEVYQTWRTRFENEVAWLNKLQEIVDEVSAREGLSDDDPPTLIIEAIREMGA